MTKGRNSDNGNGNRRINKLFKNGVDSQPKILIGIVAGIICGVVVGGWFPDFALNFSILGEIFLNALMMLVVPLVVLSMIVGITRLGDIRKLGSIGGRTVIYYLTTTGIAVLIGIVVVNIVNPGKKVSTGEKHENYEYVIGGENNRTVFLKDKTWDKTRYNEKYVVILHDQKVQGQIISCNDTSITVRFWESLDTKNVYYLSAEDGTKLQFRRIDGKLVSAEPDLRKQGKHVEIDFSIQGKLRGENVGDVGKTLKEILVGSEDSEKQGMIPSNIFKAMVHMDILPLIFFSLLLGAAMSVLGEKARPAIEILSTLNSAVMKLVYWIMYISPFGIFGLIAGRIGNAGGFHDFLPELYSLGKYSFSVLFGLAVHGFIILPLLLRLFGKHHPLSYAKGVAPALFNAFSTASSTATLPLTMRGIEEENGISSRTSGFVLPLGATINMDGTALYEAVAAIFIAQVYGIELDAIMQGVIFLTATLAAIGAAGIPEAGLVTMVIVLKAVDLPIEGIGLLLSIDWLLDRFRTSLNVWGDSVGCAVIDHFENIDRKE